MAVDDDGEIADLPIEDSIDLHAFLPKDIPSVVEEYLWEASAYGFDEVRLIHGRGTGFQRNRVREVLARHPVVAAFRDAPASRGGWGATIVELIARKQRED
jgi:dsDNA-specific endonuclease/ATPase MutS2